MPNLGRHCGSTTAGSGLRLRIAKFAELAFGQVHRKKIEREIEQLELALEDLATGRGRGR